MKDKALVVISKTNINLNHFQNNHFIIGVERGCLDLIEKKVNIDLAISDFDHVTKNELDLIKKEAKEVIHLNCDKDFLDGIAALNYLKEKNFNEIIMIVNPSKRYDMNLSIIEYVFKYNTKIINDDSLIFKLEKGKHKLNFSKYQNYTYFSLFSLVDNKISISNMKFEVKNVTLNKFNSLAYSNNFLLNKDPIIKVEDEVMVILTK